MREELDVKTAIIYGPHDLRVEDVPAPQIGPEDVLVQVKASGICGSDVHRYLGSDYGRNYWQYPMNSGHEYCGDVAQIGQQVKTFREGDKVTLGVAWPQGNLGAFSEFVYIPQADSRLNHLPPEITYLDGALIEVFIVALKSYRSNPVPGESVLILGAGPIGLCVLLLLKARGIEDITVSEPSPLRRALAQQIGAVTVNPAEQNLDEIVMSATGGKGTDVTFECAGYDVTLNQAFDLTRRGGRISLIGHYRETPRFNIEQLIIRSMSVFGPLDEHRFFDQAVQLVREGKVDLTQLVSHQFPLEQAVEAFEAACNVDESVKVLFVP
jgi:L-iditol 2-dehydrogenase